MIKFYKNITKMLIKLILSLLVIAVTPCHYSCLSCTGPEYTSCLNCTEWGNFTVVQNTSETPSIYWASVYNTGTCVPTIAQSANALGIVVFILVITVALFFRSKQTFYLMFTLQTYGLYNLLEIAWVNPVGYVLQGLQHFMIFNTMGFNYKTEDYLLVASKNYRIDSFLGTTLIGQNLAIIAPFTLIALILLIVIAVIALKKKKQPKKNNKQSPFDEERDEQMKSSKKSEIKQNNQNKVQSQKHCCECWRTFSEQFLIKIAKFLLTILFLMVQQTMVVLLVTLVYQVPVSKTIISLGVIYLHILVFVMSYCYYFRIEYFTQKKIMYLTFAHKIVLPVFVVVPIKYQFLFIIFAILFVIGEFIFDKMNGLYESFNRLAIYKVCEAICVLVLTIYFIVQKSAGSYPVSKSAAIAATFFIAFNLFLFFGVELPLSIKQKYFSSKEEKEQNIQQKNMVQLLPNDTLNTIHQKEKQEEHQIQVLDVEEQEDSHDSDQDDNKNKKDQPTLDGNSAAAEVVRIQPQRTIVSRQQQNEQVKEPEPKPSAAPKKRRKQIIDPELRIRYGI